MRALIQRVTQAQVDVAGETVGKIANGLLVFLGISAEDSKADPDYLVEKIVNLRIFADKDGKFNLSLLACRGELLIVSQFTLYADCRKGRRPAFTKAAPPEKATALYEKFISKAKAQGIKVATGKFGAYMQVKLKNDGPVTIMLDSAELKKD